ncbi:MAG TPA: hypothetical protein VGK14_08230 [Novimethylophilus sp.]|jgi:hypothetical protein|uniref:hypothetical protein n=1 Tax=Novimethylophilus sp. TaxID=2137426 RepID=UPI002F41B566
MTSDEKTKRIIDIKPVSIRSAGEERCRQLESEITMQIEQLPPLGDDDWGKIQVMLNHEASLFRKAQVAKCRAILNVLGPARNTAAWTSQDDYLAYDLYLTTYRETLDYLIHAESLLGHLEEQEYALFDDLDLNKAERLEIYLSWLKRRFCRTGPG